MLLSKIGSKLHYFLCSFIAGALITFAFAPYNIWPLSILVPALLLFLWDKFPERKMLSSFIFGTGYFSAGSWIFYSLKDHSDLSFAICISATILFLCALALSFLLVHIVVNKIPGNKILKYLIYYPFGWFLAEYFRTKSQLAYPWLFLAYSQTTSPIINLSHLLGVFGTSSIVVLLAACCYLTIRDRSKFCLILLIALTATITYFSAIKHNQSNNKEINTVLIQGNVSEQDKWDKAKLSNLIQNYENMILSNMHRNYVFILPETAIPKVPYEATNILQKLKSELISNNSSLMLGTFTIDQEQNIHNSIVSMGLVNAVNSKRRLVAFGETTPDIPGLTELANTFDFPMSNIKPSKEPNHNINIQGLKLATFICYEIAFPEEVNTRAQDADVLVVISDNIWFGSSNASFQHRQIGRFYAIMLGKPMLFVNNSGVSSIINANGDIVKELPNNAKGIIDYKLTF